MYTRINFSFSLLLLLFIGIASGCVTKKKKEDVSKLGKHWHDMNARYNAYYNATVLLQESQLALEQQHTDNYNKILPIYKYTAADNPKAEAENLDVAIEKMAVDVKLHQPSHWVDDCYVLAGKAMFLKQDFETAEETFEYVMAEFSPQKMKERESVSKARRERMKAVKKGKAPVKGEDGERVQLTKKQRQKLAKKKRKMREKERKQKQKAAKKLRKQKQKARKKGKPVPKSTPKKEETKKEEQKPTEEVVVKDTLPLGPDGYPLPGSVRLGGMDTKIEAGEAENYFLKHRPAYQEGVLWLARTLIERENFNEAERLLGQLERNSTTYPDIRRDAAVAKAHLFMKQNKHDLAVQPLEAALETTDDKVMAARLQYILGQIHQEAGRGSQAYAAFEKVLKSQPTFEMEFGARLNLAMAGVNSDEESIRQLERMLKEEKNQDFQDRIYFAMAEIDLKNGDKKSAIEHLEMALGSSSRDMAQKAEAYLLLADLYYEAENYVDAKLYYDSTLLVLNQQDGRYARANSLASNLEGISENITIIETQDSLLAISRMTDEERRLIAFNIKKEQERKRREEAMKKAGPATGGKAPVSTGGRPSGGGGINGSSNFWAYDDKKVKDGKRDFDRKWGSRVLADNWRLSNQESVEEGDEAAEIDDPSVLTEEEIDDILKDVPGTPDEIAAANRQIEAAMYTLGTQYRNKIQSYDNSVETLKELLNRYPETQYKLDALYYLYLAYTDLGDAANAQYYFDKIVNEYPNTNYARMLRDPNFAQNVNSKENELVKYYDETYAQFTNRQYKAASERISKVGEKFGSTNKLQPRFALLNAMCIGNLEGKEQYIDALKGVIARHPEEPEAKTAREMLRNLGIRANGPGQQRAGEEGQVGNYKVNDTQLHYVIVVFYNDISLNDAKVGVSEYNSKFHSLQKLRMNNIYLGTGEEKRPIVAIRRFKDKVEAMDYFDGVKKNEADFLDKKAFDYALLPISQDNYRELLKSKALEDYRNFFELNYLK